MGIFAGLCGLRFGRTNFGTARTNFGTAEKPIVYRRGKPSIKKYPNHKKRKLKDDEKAKVVNKSQKKVVHNSDPDWEDF